MQMKLILAALHKHRLATLLITLEIALACAVLCNAGFLIANRVAQMQVQSGVDEAALGVISLQGFAPEQAVDLNARVLAGLRAIPGIKSVSVINAVPFGEHAGTAGITTDQAGKQFAGVPHFYVAGPGAFEALGLHVVAGRPPAAADYAPIVKFVPEEAQVLVTRALAEHVWPGQAALGKVFWGFDTSFRVMGVLDHFVRPSPPGFGPGQEQWSIFVPAQPGRQLAGRYLIRAEPKDLNQAMLTAENAMRRIAPDVVVDREQSQPIPVLRERAFLADRAMTRLLMGVIAALLGITAFGIVGLTSFWVAQRRKQIGIRRALGATRLDILRYFQAENFLIVTFGVALGVLLAIAINLGLMGFFEVPRLPLWYLPVGAIALWLLGQLAVLAPALRAAAVPPVVATRGV